jgi:hypothetical protein
MTNSVVNPATSGALTRALMLAMRRNDVAHLEDALQPPRQMPLFQWNQMTEFVRGVARGKSQSHKANDQRNLSGQLNCHKQYLAST